MGNKRLAAQLIAAMSAVVEAPNYHLLKSYKKDFYEMDVSAMQNFFAEDRYLWVVRENGTYLTQLGVHLKHSEMAKATIHQSNDTKAGREVYLVTAKGLSLLTHARAMDEIRKLDYEVTRNAVFRKRDNLLVATYTAKVRNENGNVLVSFAYQTSHLDGLNVGMLNALRAIAVGEGTQLASTFFMRINQLTINGQSLTDLIESKSIGVATAVPA